MMRELFVSVVCNLARTSNVTALRIVRISDVAVVTRWAEFRIGSRQFRILLHELPRSKYLEGLKPAIDLLCGLSDVFMFNWGHHTKRFAHEMIPTMRGLESCRRLNRTVLFYTGTNAPHYPHDHGWFDPLINHVIIFNSSRGFYQCGMPPNVSLIEGDRFSFQLRHDVLPNVPGLRLVPPPWGREDEALDCVETGGEDRVSLNFVPNYDLSILRPEFHLSISKNTGRADCLHLHYHPNLRIPHIDALFWGIWRDSGGCQSKSKPASTFVAGNENNLDAAIANFKILDQETTLLVGLNGTHSTDWIEAMAKF
jgi:hypothetical protein